MKNFIQKSISKYLYVYHPSEGKRDKTIENVEQQNKKIFEA